MNTQLTSQLLIFPHPTYTIETIASALGVLPDSIWAITDEKSIKIDTVRRLQQELSTSSAGNQIRHVVLYPAEIITNQAQQALLKLIEEPPQNTQLTLVTTSISQVLPTIQSRCVVRSIQSPETSEKREDSSSIFQQLSRSTSWEAVVSLSQQLPTKREELRQILQEEYAQEFPNTEIAVIFQETLAEVLESLDHNVQPTLCVEKLLFHTYKKAAE